MSKKKKEKLKSVKTQKSSLSKRSVIVVSKKKRKRLTKKAKAERERKAELAKLLRKRGPNPYSAVRYHKGYVYDPVRYTVLTGSLLSKDITEMVTSTLKPITTGPDAAHLPEIPGWSVEEMSKYHDGRLILVRHNGTEVALYFKRQLTEIIPQPGEKTPECVLQDPKHAWQRLDLLDRSAEKQHFVLTTEHRRLEEENKLLTKNNQSLDDLNDRLEKKIGVYERTINKLVSEKKELEKRLRAFSRAQVPSKPHKRAVSRGYRHKHYFKHVSIPKKALSGRKL